MGLDRRAFITFILGSVAGFGITPIQWKLMDDIAIWTQNWSWIPRIPKRSFEYVKTASKLDPGGCGMRVLKVGGRPVTVAGDPDHPLSRGGISALAASEVNLLYSPARIKGPMKKAAVGFEPVSWAEAEAMLVEKLVKAKGRTAFVSGDETGTSTEVFSAFMEKTGGAYFPMPCEAQAAAGAWKALGGEGRVGYDIENSDYVLLLGADALDSWGTAVRNAKAFSETHPAGARATAKYVYAGPVRTSTAVVCDAWVPAAPGTSGTMALGVAYHLMADGAAAKGVKGFGSFKRTVASGFTPDAVERRTGVGPDVLAGIARDLRKAKKPLVIVGSEFEEGAGVDALKAGLAVNLLLNRLNRPGGIQAVAEAPRVLSAKVRGSRDFASFMADVGQGRAKAPEVLLVHEANPAYTLPHAETLERIPFKVSFSSFMDETAKSADLILPAPLTLERFDDVYTPYGAGRAVYSVNKPVIKPVCDAKSTPDFILGVAGKMKMDMGFSSFEAVIQAKAEALGADTRSLAQGKAWTMERTVAQNSLNVARAAGVSAARADAGYSLALAPVVKRNIGSAKMAIPPLSVATIMNNELGKDGFYVKLNKKTARKYGLREGDHVKLAGPKGECKAMVHIHEGVMTGVVAAPLGFGHTAWDSFSKGKGDNVYKLLAAASGGLNAGSRVNIAKT